MVWFSFIRGLEITRYCNYTYLVLLKPESKFWKELKDNCSDIHWTRFENWATPGVPDVFGISNGINVFVELKVITSNKIKLRPFQISWNYSHSLHGGRSFIMAKALPQRLLYIFTGSLVLSIADKGLRTDPKWVVDLQGPQPWQQVQRILLHSPLPKPKAL